MKKYTFLNRMAAVIFVLGLVASFSLAIYGWLNTDEISFWNFVGIELLAMIVGDGGMLLTGKVASMANDALENVRKEEEKERELRVRKELRKLYW